MKVVIGEPDVHPFRQRRDRYRFACLGGAVFRCGRFSRREGCYVRGICNARRCHGMVPPTPKGPLSVSVEVALASATSNLLVQTKRERTSVAGLGDGCDS